VLHAQSTRTKGQRGGARQLNVAGLMSNQPMSHLHLTSAADLCIDGTLAMLAHFILSCAFGNGVLQHEAGKPNALCFVPFPPNESVAAYVKEQVRHLLY
jgi:hypothetical protein